MKLSQDGIEFIKSLEGCKLNAYQDSAGIWTIGYGIIQYEDGTPVKKGDMISQQRANDLLEYEVDKKTKSLAAYLPDGLKQNQIDSLISLCYNIGVGAFAKSTLLKKIKSNPNDPTIREAFLMWNKAKVKGKLTVVDGLTARRTKEADHYFS